MKLGNEGFAITGILYTIFVLFLMILLSVLGGLNIKRKLLEKNIDETKESLEEKCQTLTENITLPYTTKYSGKYIIDINGDKYATYLSKGSTIDDLSTLYYVGNSPISYSNAKIVEICTTETVS